MRPLAALTRGDRATEAEISTVIPTLTVTTLKEVGAVVNHQAADRIRRVVSTGHAGSGGVDGHAVFTAHSNAHGRRLMCGCTWPGDRAVVAKQKPGGVMSRRLLSWAGLVMLPPTPSPDWPFPSGYLWLTYVCPIGVGCE